MLLKTKEAIEQHGMEVKLFNLWEDKLKDFDILHIFGSVKDCLGLMQAAKSLKLKVALSPIYWSTLQRAFYEYGDIYKKSLMCLQHMTKVVFPAAPSARREMMMLADKLLPNSQAEAIQVSRLFKVRKEKMHVVPLGVDDNFEKAGKETFIAKYGIRDFILSVGRIEPRKNQLNLIKAVKHLDLPLIIIGDPVQGYEKYYQECRSASDKNVFFIKRLAHNDPLLASAYAACKVFALQGWFETPGLAALEAGLAGARLAVTKYGSTKEYFNDYAEYLNPACAGSIKDAIILSLNKDNQKALKRHIKDNYLWSNSAQETIKAYKELLR